MNIKQNNHIDSFMLFMVGLKRSLLPIYYLYNLIFRSRVHTLIMMKDWLLRENHVPARFATSVEVMDISSWLAAGSSSSLLRLFTFSM